MEYYPVEKNIRFGKRDTDRLKIYRHALEDPGCQIVLNGLPAEALFYDPFDQLMRHMLGTRFHLSGFSSHIVHPGNLGNGPATDQWCCPSR